MKTLILAAGRFGQDLSARIADGLEPRLDVFELASVLGADVMDYSALDRSAWRYGALKSAAARSVALAELGFRKRKDYDAFLTTGEDIGLPLAALLRRSAARCSHTMIGHTLRPRKKRLFFDYLGVRDRIDRLIVYSTTEERLALDELAFAPHKVLRIFYHADERFFRADGHPLEPDLICGAGQLLRDYPTLVRAVEGLPVRLQIAAGSPWIDKPLARSESLPPNVRWEKLNRHALRDLYARAALAVVPILENEYQTGIATILEMMAMGKCVIVTRTRGQIDTIVDGVTGLYVPPSDPIALRAAIERMLQNPEEAARIGRAAREFVEREAGLDQFVARVASTVREAHAERGEFVA